MADRPHALALVLVLVSLIACSALAPQLPHRSRVGRLLLSPARTPDPTEFKATELEAAVSGSVSQLSTTEDDGYSLRNRQPKWLRNLWNRVIARKSPGTLILIRHGESELNNNGTFTGWIDSDMNENGVRDMEYAARLMLERGFTVDITYTSRLKRAIRSTWTILTELEQVFRPVYKSWRLNERCYGAMEGRSKAQLAIEIGEDKVQEVRKSLTARPPPMTEEHPHWHRNERKYADLNPEDIPVTESVADCLARTLPLWKNRILPELISGKTVMVVAHANSLRGLIKHIDSLSEDDIKQVFVPNAIPLVYKFDSSMRPLKTEDSVAPISASFLGDPKSLNERINLERKWGEKVPGLENAKNSPRTAAAAAAAKAKATAVAAAAAAAATDSNSNAIVTTSEALRVEALASTSCSTFDPSDPILVLMRHGKTENNKLGIFTGWVSLGGRLLCAIVNRSPFPSANIQSSHPHPPPPTPQPPPLYAPARRMTRLWQSRAGRKRKKLANF